MQVVEHISEEAINRYRERTSTPAEFLAVQAHIGGCEECRSRLARAVDAGAATFNLQRELTLDGLRQASEPEHLPYEQLAFYVDGQLDDVAREIAESHLAVCLGCAGDVADLRRYQAIAAAPGVASPKTSNATTTIQPARTAAHVNEKAWWQRLLSFDFLPAFGGGVPAMAAAALILAVILLVAWLALRSNAPNKGELVRVELDKRGIVTPSPSATVPPPVVVNPPDNLKANSNAPSTIQTPPAPLPKQAPRLWPQQTPRNDATTDASLLIALNDADGRVALDEQGNVRGLESLSSSAQAAVRRSLQEQRVQTPPALSALTEGNNAVLMSGGVFNSTNGGVPFALVSPVGAVMRETQPTLRWRPLAGAIGYTVAIVDASFRVVEQSGRLAATEWTPGKPLPRGANYSWQVTAIQADGTEVISPVSPAPQAKFRVMEQSAFDDVTRLENSGVRSHLARGVVYAQAGLLNEARAEFSALVRDNPHSTLARKLLDSVKK